MKNEALKRGTRRPLNIGYLCLQWSKEGQAAFAHVHEIVRGLRGNGYNVSLFEPIYPESRSRPGIASRIAKFLQLQFQVSLKLSELDVLYIREHVGTLPIVILCALRSVPIVLEVNGPLDDLFIAHPWTRKFKYVVAGATQFCRKIPRAVIAVTQQLAEELRSVRSDEVIVIPNGADTDLFVPDAVESVTVEGNYVVFFGALARWQGLEILLKAVRHPEWPSEIDLVIMGDGVMKSDVLDAVRAGRVKYLGALPYRSIPGVVSRSVASICAKNHDAHVKSGLFPLKVVESMACGVPVVISDIAGVAEIVSKHKAGILVPVNDERAIASAVRKLYENPALRTVMGQNGRAITVKEHSWTARANETAKVIESVFLK